MDTIIFRWSEYSPIVFVRFLILPILLVDYLNNYLTLRPETSTYDYYRANLELRRFWVTWPACDVI